MRSGGQEGGSEPSEHAPGLPTSSGPASASSSDGAAATSLEDAIATAQPADTAGAATPTSNQEDGRKPLAAAVACIHIIATAGVPSEEIWRPPPSPDATLPGIPPSASARLGGSPPRSHEMLVHRLTSTTEHARCAADGHTSLRTLDASAAPLQGNAASAAGDVLGVPEGNDDQPKSGPLTMVRSVSLREAYGGSPTGPQPADQPAEASTQPRGRHHGVAISGDGSRIGALPPGLAALRAHGATCHGSCSEATWHVPVDDVEDEADAAFSLLRTARMASALRLSAIKEADDVVGASPSLFASRPREYGTVVSVSQGPVDWIQVTCRSRHATRPCMRVLVG